MIKKKSQLNCAVMVKTKVHCEFKKFEIRVQHLNKKIIVDIFCAINAAAKSYVDLSTPLGFIHLQECGIP